MNEKLGNWEAVESADIVLKVRKAQVQLLYRQTWGGLAGTLTIAFSVCILLWQVIPQWELLLWTGILVLLSTARGFLSAAFKRKSPNGTDIYLWAKLHLIGVVASGLMWTLPSIFLWPANSPVHQLVWPICIVALAASGVAKYFTWIPSYVSFLCLSVIPISLRLLIEGGLVYTGLGLLGFLFTAIYIQTGKVMHDASLRSLIVGTRNEALSAILTEEKTKEEELNAHLHQEIAEHTRSQEELRLRNQELEQLNAQLTATKDNLESSNKELELALFNVKQLSGMLPICASCKKIRNDKGYWEQIEAYIRDHSEVEFSHGICPDCAEKLYPGYYKKAEKS
jgi:hypothetical protein